MSSVLFTPKIFPQGNAREFFDRDSLDEDSLSSLIAKEEKKLNIMAGQFSGNYSLLHLQQKLIHALNTLLGLVANPASSPQEIQAFLTKILSLYQEIDHKISAAEREQRLLEASMLSQSKLIEQILIVADENVEDKKRQHQYAAIEEMKKQHALAAAKLAALQYQAALAAKQYAEQQAESAQRIRTIVEKIVKDNILKLQSKRFLSLLENLPRLAPHSCTASSYFWHQPHAASEQHTITIKNPSALHSISLKQEATLHAYAHAQGLLCETHGKMGLTFSQKNTPQIQIVFQGENVHITMNSLHLDNLRLLEKVLETFRQEPKLNSRLRPTLKF